MEPYPEKRKSQHSQMGSRKSPRVEGEPGPTSKTSFAARMMAKMGYEKGQGLGRSGEGILNPIEVKLRPQGVGVGAVREKTEQAKAEAKRAALSRGEDYEESSEEERKARRRRRKELVGDDASGVSRRPNGSKVHKTKYRTASEIEAESGGLVVPSVLKYLIDATGKENKLLTSMSGLMVADQPNSAEQIKVENLQRKARVELESFSEAWNEIKDRKLYTATDEETIQGDIERKQKELREFDEILDRLDTLSLSASQPLLQHEDINVRWKDAITDLETLQAEYHDDIVKYGLSDIAITLLLPLLRVQLQDWDPLQDPTRLALDLRRLREILGLGDDSIQSQNGSDMHLAHQRKTSTMYETLIQTLWLPKIRTSIINDWDPCKPNSLLILFESWEGILPAFVRYNLVNKVIQPRLVNKIQSWKPRAVGMHKNGQTHYPHIWLFPWLPYIDGNLLTSDASDGILTEIKRKYNRFLDTCDLSAGDLAGLEHWRAILKNELDHMLVRRILPRLARLLSTKLEINPADQDITPIEHILAWNAHFKPSVFGQLLVAELFPKWLDVLHLWLTSEVDYTEVAEWFEWWKGQFPSEINAVATVADLWNRGLQLMNEALDLGDEAKEKLRRPQYDARPIPSTDTDTNPAISTKRPVKAVSLEDVEEATFKDVVEAWCSDENLILMPIREAHDLTGLPLFRITANATGKGGILVYFKGDVIWAQNRKDKRLWEPLGLDDELVKKAEGR